MGDYYIIRLISEDGSVHETIGQYPLSEYYEEFRIYSDKLYTIGYVLENLEGTIKKVGKQTLPVYIYRYEYTTPNEGN